MRKVRWGAVVASLAVALAACSGSDGSSGGTTAPVLQLEPASSTAPQSTVAGGTPEQYATALATGLGVQQYTKVVVATDAERACVAPKWVAILTPERLEQGGIAPGDLAAASVMDRLTSLGLGLDTGRSLAGALAGCGIDLRARAIDYAAEGASAEQRACLASALDETLAVDYFAAGLARFRGAEAGAIADTFEQRTGPCEAG